MRTLWLFVALGVLLAGCPRRAARTPTESAVMRGNERVYESVRAGAREAGAGSAFQVPVRYNPAACDCPAYEVFAYGRWIRAYVDGDERTREMLRELEDADDLAVVEIRGRLADELRTAPSRVRYPVFVAPSE